MELVCKYSQYSIVLKTWFWYYIIYFGRRLKIKLWTVSLYKEICNDFEIVQGAIWHIKSRPNQIGHLPRNIHSSRSFCFVYWTIFFIRTCLTKYIGTFLVRMLSRRIFKCNLNSLLIYFETAVMKYVLWKMFLKYVYSKNKCYFYAKSYPRIFQKPIHYKTHCTGTAI